MVAATSCALATAHWRKRIRPAKDFPAVWRFARRRALFAKELFLFDEISRARFHVQQTANAAIRFVGANHSTRAQQQTAEHVALHESRIRAFAHRLPANL